MTNPLSDRKSKKRDFVSEAERSMRSVQLHALEVAASIADAEAKDNQRAERLARAAGRIGVADCRQSDSETALRIAAEIRSLKGGKK